MKFSKCFLRKTRSLDIITLIPTLSKSNNEYFLAWCHSSSLFHLFSPLPSTPKRKNLFFIQHCYDSFIKPWSRGTWCTLVVQTQFHTRWEAEWTRNLESVPRSRPKATRGRVPQVRTCRSTGLWYDHVDWMRNRRTCGTCPSVPPRGITWWKE